VTSIEIGRTKEKGRTTKMLGPCYYFNRQKSKISEIRPSVKKLRARKQGRGEGAAVKGTETKKGVGEKNLKHSGEDSSEKHAKPL